MRGHPPTESISRNSASLERPVVTLSRSNRLGCRPGRSSQAGTLSKELQMLRMTILGLGTLLILGTADLQAQVDPDQPATAAQDARQDVRPDTRPDTRPDVRPDARPDRRPDRRPDARPDSRPDVRPDRRPDARPDRPDTRPDRRPDVRPDHRPDVRPDHRPDVRPDSRPDARPDRRPDVRPDRRPDVRPDSHRVRPTTIDRRRDAAPRRGRSDGRRIRSNPR